MTNVFEACDICGFQWDEVSPEEIAPRMIASMNASSELIARNQEASLVRYRPDQWSALEYGCHLSDVLYNIRDKMVLITDEDNPASLMLHGTPRVELGLYAHDRPQVLALEMRLAGELFARTFTALPIWAHEREFLYRYPREAMRTLLWVASQALHECEHHTTDIQHLLAN